MPKYTKKTRMRSLKKRRGKKTKRKKSKTKINYLTTIIKVLDNTPMDEETMARYKLIKNYALRHPKKINKMISKLLKKQFKHAKPALETASSNSSNSYNSYNSSNSSNSSGSKVGGGGKGQDRKIQPHWKAARKEAMNLARKIDPLGKKGLVRHQLRNQQKIIDQFRDATCPTDLSGYAGWDPEGCKKYFNKGKDKLKKLSKKQVVEEDVQHPGVAFIDSSDLKHLDHKPLRAQLKPSEQLSHIKSRTGSKLQPYDNRNMFQPKTVELVGAPSLIGQRDIKQYLINHPIDIGNCTQLVNNTTGNITYQCKNLEGEAGILMKNFRAPLGIENSHTPTYTAAYGSAIILLQLFLAFRTRKLRSARMEREKKEEEKEARKRKRFGSKRNLQIMMHRLAYPNQYRNRGPGPIRRTRRALALAPATATGRTSGSESRSVPGPINRRTRRPRRDLALGPAIATGTSTSSSSRIAPGPPKPRTTGTSSSSRRPPVPPKPRTTGTSSSSRRPPVPPKPRTSSSSRRAPSPIIRNQQLNNLSEMLTPESSQRFTYLPYGKNLEE